MFVYLKQLLKLCKVLCYFQASFQSQEWTVEENFCCISNGSEAQFVPHRDFILHKFSEQN